MWEIIFKSNEKFVFREWALLLYCFNYLVAPAITYGLNTDQVAYSMKIHSDKYFSLALPGFYLLALGMYVIPTDIFNLNIKGIEKGAQMNKGFLINVTIVALIFRLISNFVPSDLSFILYLLSLIRFISAFALLSIDGRLWFWTAIVLTIELVTAFLNGMYHDVLMWLVFFGLFFTYSKKLSMSVKLLGVIFIVTLILFVQSLKGIYRSEVWGGEKEATLNTVYELGSEQAKSETLLGEQNLLSTLNRGNQAWIFASTVDHMDKSGEFQGLATVQEYLTAAILPRFLAPNKIKAGSRDIFNKFSGHYLNEGTAMGLGVFADGYIAYGDWGVYLFCFVLGLIFALTFKLVEQWSKVSPFYVLFLFPLLNYAVRPDCELQTTINHLTKGILVYGFLVTLTKYKFVLQETMKK
jgi:hypothetical protein